MANALANKMWRINHINVLVRFRVLIIPHLQVGTCTIIQQQFKTHITLP